MGGVTQYGLPEVRGNVADCEKFEGVIGRRTLNVGLTVVESWGAMNDKNERVGAQNTGASESMCAAVRRQTTGIFMNSQDKAQHVLRAANGDAESLRTLANHIRDASDPDPSIAHSIIHLLDSVLIPDDFSYRQSEDRQRPNSSCFAAMGALSVMMALCLTNHSKRSSALQVVQVLKDYYPHIIRWIEFFVSKGVFLRSCAAFLTTIALFHGTLEEVVLGSKSTVELIVAWWIHKGDNISTSQEHDSDMASHPSSPINLLFLLVVEDSRSRPIFRQVSAASPATVGLIARAMKTRLTELEEGIRAHSSTVAFVVARVLELARLLRQILNRKEHYVELFHSERLIFSISSTLQAATFHQEKGPEFWVNINDILRHIFSFIVKPGFGCGSPIKKVIDALNGGLLTVLVKSLIVTPPTTSSHAFCLCFLSDITAYCIYRDVVVPLSTAVKNLVKWGVVAQAPAPHAPKFSERWVAIVSFLIRNAKVYDCNGGREVLGSVCNGPGCPMAQELRSRVSVARKCSRCHSISYCSETCQKRDWRAHHRDECLEEQQLRPKGQLPLRDRATIASYIANLCTEYYSTKFQEARTQRKIFVPLESLILSVNGISIPTGVDVTTVANYRSRNIAIFHYHLWSRIDRYLEDFTLRPNIHLAEAIFPLGGCTVHLLVRLLKGEGGDFRVLGFISGITRSMALDNRQCTVDAWSAQNMRYPVPI
ncbi:hypothetical protein DFP72DRAFT_1137734 [Ephemerocybe angulata]|uniref:MYND-type domain-containing protein n=1 Tax=Ephemerocybe angulata TaxID=980116 RepID=A0A8H6HQE7_9AGAR|nr:hypothetical protein DFP72DRAFT_1137734 [Tulosesus angulatus]